MEKAVKLLGRYFIPYINGCLLSLYPYEKCCRPFYHTTCTLGLYVSIYLKFSDGFFAVFLVLFFQLYLFLSFFRTFNLIICLFLKCYNPPLNCKKILQEKRCAIQIDEICNDCPNSTVIEKLLEEANRPINGYVRNVLINGNTEVSETHNPANGSASQEVRIAIRIPYFSIPNYTVIKMN